MVGSEKGGKNAESRGKIMYSKCGISSEVKQKRK
jgi:hypothetical protein